MKTFTFTLKLTVTEKNKALALADFWEWVDGADNDDVKVEEEND